MLQTLRESSFFTTVFLLASLAGVAPVRAKQFVVPGSLATIEGDRGFSVNGLVGGGDVTWQFQITAAELSALGLNTGDQLTGMRGRREGGAATGPGFAIDVTDLEITLAAAANALGSMSTSFASNMTSPVLVRDGAYTLPAFSMPGGNTPNAFAPLISFDTAYTYQGGDLVVMYTRTNPGSGTLYDGANAYAGLNTAYRTMYSPTTFHATTGGFVDAMVVYQFEVIPVPEPTTLGLIGMGLSALLAGRHRKA